jgi:hypothetical protein
MDRAAIFIADSGASYHAASDASLLIDFEPTFGRSFEAANGGRLVVAGFGKLRLSCTRKDGDGSRRMVVLDSVAYMNKLAVNVFSKLRLRGRARRSRVEATRMPLPDHHVQGG